MASKNTSVRALDDARERMERWRQEHGGRRRIPEPFWVEATKLARRHGVYRVSQMLRLNFRRLKERVDAEKAAPSKAEREISFVEIDAAMMAASGGLQIEVHDEHGRVLRIRGASRDDAAHIASAFCAQGVRSQ